LNKLPPEQKPTPINRQIVKELPKQPVCFPTVGLLRVSSEVGHYTEQKRCVNIFWNKNVIFL
jgi:hypothetical protein